MVEISPRQAELYRAIGDEPVTKKDMRAMLKVVCIPTTQIKALLDAGLLEEVGAQKVKILSTKRGDTYVKAKKYKKVIKPYKVKEK